ncbi:MAG: outer membrane beta-barrel family protein [Muribaculaceae bacterium]|nr:outer membrane beta-barrel family protein [Muribaculaceae bacterium]
MKKYISLLVLLTAISVRAAEPTDTISAETADSIAVNHELAEFVIVGERSWIEGNKAVFLPTKQEKNLATDPASLIQRMKIPLLVVEDGVIKNVQGNTVPVYINGVLAEGIDISTFWAKQTNRVEYIDHPTDPKYNGAQAVVNIIMPEYEVGGITKLSASQNMPGGGSYDVASKLVYKKMTYGLLAQYGYRRNHSNSQLGTESYKGIYYDNRYYEDIDHDYSSHSWSRYDNLSVSLNARYVSPKTKFANTISLQRTNNPGSGMENSDSWTPNLFSSHSSGTSTTSRSLSPQMFGNLSHTFTDKVSSSTFWSYSYAHNDASSTYRNGELTPILNGTREDVHSASLSEMVAYILKPGTMALFFNAGTSMNWYSTLYTGSANTHQRQWRGQTNVSVSYRTVLAEKFSLSVDPGLLLDYWHLYGTDTHFSVKPAASLTLIWNINRRSSLTAFVRHFSSQPSASQSGDVIIRQDELNWLKANSELKNNSTWMSDINYFWMQSRTFTMNASLSYIREENQLFTIYEAAPSNMGGVIRTYANGSTMNSYTLNIHGGLRLLKERLYIMLQPVFLYSEVGGVYARSLFHTRLRAYASYELGNFSINAYYSTPQKDISDGGLGTDWYAQSLNLGATYGNGEFYVNLSFDGLLNRKSKSKHYLNGGVYESHETSFTIGRQINLRVTYTFGYGKRVERNIDIESGGEIKTGVLGSDL